MALKMNQKDLTAGRESATFLLFAAPFVLAYLLQAFYNAAELLVVGAYDQNAGLSAVNLGSTVSLLLIQFLNGLAMGGTILIAQYTGARAEEVQQRTSATLFSLLTLCSLVLSATAFFLRQPILALLHTPPEALPSASAYLVIILPGTLFIVGYHTVCAILRGTGDAVRPLIFTLTATFLNIGLSFLCIGVAGWGATGAAVATVAAQTLSFFFAIWMLRRSPFPFHFSLAHFHLDKDTLIPIVKIGCPLALQGTVNTLSFLALARLINQIGGVSACAISGICTRLNGFSILSNFAVASAIAAMAGQNIGAQKLDRARRTFTIGLWTALSFSGALCLLVNLFPQTLLSLFHAQKDAVVAGIPYLRAVSFDYLVSAVLFAANGLLNGAGYSHLTLLHTVLAGVLRIPLAYLFAHTFSLGFTGVGWALSAATLPSMLLSLFFVARGVWKKPRIVIKPAG